MKYWYLWFAAGVLSVLAGIIAFLNPFSATLTAELLAGYMFTAIGILTLISAFQDQGWGARIWALLLGVILTVFGFNLIAEPFVGILRLTYIVALLMLMIGVFRIVIGLTPMASGARVILILTGIVSIVISLMIFASFPWSSAVVLGVYLAIELISNGVSLIFVALERRKRKTETV